jgi:hypothetical protein
MRLALCIVVCLCGMLIMGYIFGIEALQTLYSSIENALGAKLVLFIVAAFMVVFGAAGVRLPMRTPPQERKIVFHSEYGDIEIQLGSVERNIKRVLKKLPEIHKVKVRVFADDTQEHAIVEADCVLTQYPDSPEHAHQVANRISGYIALMARKTMGLEELATIKVNVVNVHYDGSLPISSILEPPDEPFAPILLEHDEDQLEVVEPQENFFQEAEEDIRAEESAGVNETPEAPPYVEEEEHLPVSEGPALGDDLGSDFDDFDFSSIHDASGDDGHEISQAGFEMPDTPPEGHSTEAGAGEEPDFKIVDMRIKAKAEEDAAEDAKKAEAAIKNDAPQKAQPANQSEKQPGNNKPAKSKRKRGRKAKRRK